MSGELASTRRSGSVLGASKIIRLQLPVGVSRIVVRGMINFLTRGAEYFVENASMTYLITAKVYAFLEQISHLPAQ